MYIAFFNPQGNFDRLDSYWTMHPDFGGQLVYVKELAIALVSLGHQVDIFTRQIIDSRFPEFSSALDSYDKINGLRIVRIACGGLEFLPKELLWSHLDEWVDGIIDFCKSQHAFPDFVTGHYGDGGYAAYRMKQITGIPFSLTGHSLGAQKLDKLLTKDNVSLLESRYHFTVRISREEVVLKNADLAFTSTVQERDEQYTHPLYKPYSKQLFDEHRFVVAPPGANTKIFTTISSPDDITTVNKIENAIHRDIDYSRRFLPSIVLASRLDEKKNHYKLLESFAKSEQLQAIYNVVISLRGIENAFQDYSSASSEERHLLDRMMNLIQEYHLLHKVCFVSIDSQKELAILYRHMAKTNSVFALTSLYEPFGLAPIEAMASGLPALVTQNGGPKDVLEEGNQKFGVLVDPTDIFSIQKGLIEISNHHSFYRRMGMARVEQRYTWNATASQYAQAIGKVLNGDIPVKKLLDENLCEMENQILKYMSISEV